MSENKPELDINPELDNITSDLLTQLADHPLKTNPHQTIKSNTHPD